MHISPQGLRTAGIFSQILKAVCGVSLAALGGLSAGRLDRNRDSRSEQDFLTLDLLSILLRDMI